MEAEYSLRHQVGTLTLPLGSSLWASHTYGCGKDHSTHTSQSPPVGWAAEAQRSRSHYKSEKQLVMPGVSPGPGYICPASCLPDL